MSGEFFKHAGKVTAAFIAATMLDGSAAALAAPQPGG